MDVLGLEDTPEHDQRAVYAEFREAWVWPGVMQKLLKTRSPRE